MSITKGLNRYGSTIYATVDVGVGIAGTKVAFNKLVQTSKIIKTSIPVYRGNWVEGFVLDFPKIKIPAPSWGEKIVHGSIVTRDGMIYWIDGKGAWYELKGKIFSEN